MYIPTIIVCFIGLSFAAPAELKEIHNRVQSGNVTSGGWDPRARDFTARVDLPEYKAMKQKFFCDNIFKYICEEALNSADCKKPDPKNSCEFDKLLCKGKECEVMTTTTTTTADPTKGATIIAAVRQLVFLALPLALRW